MKTLILKVCKKFVALILAFCLMTELSAQALAEVNSMFTNGYNDEASGLSFKGIGQEQSSQISQTIQNAYERGQSSNAYENALRLMAEEARKNAEQSSAARKIASAKSTGKNKYASLWPAYLRLSAAKEISVLEQALMKTLAFCGSELQVMPYKDFLPLYENTVKLSAKNFIKENPDFSAVPYADKTEAAAAAIRKQYPAADIYKEYNKEAQAEIAWRKNNGATVAKYCRQAARAYIDAAGAPALSLQTLLILKDFELSGQKLLTQADIKAVYDYSIQRLEKQDLSSLQLSILSSESKKQQAKVLAADITERIITAAVFAQEGDKRFSSAVEELIYKSEDTAAFSQILAAGFGALLAKSSFTNLERLLKTFTEKEYEGPDFLDYLNLSHWAKAAESAGGKYLGNISQKTQYATKYSYGNTFTDIAKLLSEDGRQQSLSLLYRYGTGHKNPIKPFAAGALLSKKSGVKQNYAQTLALALINMDLGDITAVEEYDLDTALTSKYPAIKANAGKYAVITKQAQTAKANKKAVFGYIKRAAFGGDIILAVWGIAGLVKLTGKAVTLSKSVYTAAKAAKLQTNAARLSFIRANYAVLTPYVSAQRSLARLSNGVKSRAGLAVPARQTAKLSADLRRKNIAALEQQKTASALKAAQVNTPKAAAKAELDAQKYNTAVLQHRLVLSQNLYGQSYNLKAGAYLDKVRAYNSGKLSAVPQAPAFTAGENNYAALYKGLQRASADLKTAQASYDGLKWYNRLLNPVKNWWNKPYAGNLGFGLAEMETGSGTTLAKVLHLPKITYTTPAAAGNSAAVIRPLDRISKVYRWFDNHNMPLAANGLRFINNKAAVLGTTLLFNYNIATITPALANGTKAVALTERVISAPQSARAVNTFTISAGDITKTSGLNFTNLSPVDAVDPRIFRQYGTLPLISGNLLQGRGAAYWAGSAANILRNTAAAASLPAFFVKDIFSTGHLFKAPSLFNPFTSILAGRGLSKIAPIIFQKDAKPREQAFIYNFLAATTVTATAPLISQIYGLDTGFTNTFISLISYVPAIATPFMGYFFKRYGVTNMAKVAAAGTLGGVLMTIAGGFNGFSNSGTTLGLITTLGGITLISLSNEIKYSTIYPLIDTNFNTQKALSLTTQTSMARSLGTIFFLELGPALNFASTSLGFGEVNNTIAVPLLLLPLSTAALVTMMKGNYKDVPMPKEQTGNPLKGLVDVFKTDGDARKAAGSFAAIEAAELTTSLLVFSMAQEFYGPLSNIPNILGGVLIYTTMGLARMACGELQKRGILTSLGTYRVSSALTLSGLGMFALGGISPVGLLGATMYFVGDANLFPPLLNTTLKGKGDKTANITLLIFSVSTLAACGGYVLGLVSDLAGSLQFAVVVPISFLVTALSLAKPVFDKDRKTVYRESSDFAASLVYANGEKDAKSAKAEKASDKTPVKAKKSSKKLSKRK